SNLIFPSQEPHGQMEEMSETVKVTHPGVSLRENVKQQFPSITPCGDLERLHVPLKNSTRWLKPLNIQDLTVCLCSTIGIFSFDNKKSKFTARDTASGPLPDICCSLKGFSILEDKCQPSMEII
ncbi:unnamed protein product, partial [Bubo scandiacus]